MFRVAAFCFWCVTTVATGDSDAQFNAGFIQLSATAQAPPLGIWYPSTSVEVVGKLGPFRPTFAWHGEAARGAFPVIVLSHGRGGRYRNHRDTAAALARAGYVVVAPDHLADGNIKSKSAIVSAVTVRVSEVKRALSAAEAHPVIEQIADTAQLGAVGYSLGTVTALYAAGATPKMSRFEEHCREFSRDDINFCGGGGGWVAEFFAYVRETVAWLKEKGMLRAQSTRTPQAEFSPISPVDFSAIALIAPVGAPFPAEAVREQNAAIALFRLGDDDEVRYPYHAEYLHLALNNIPHLYKTFTGVHHYAFISPFPAWLMAEENIPVAHDPEGFDREQFIRDINTDIVNFFRANL